MVKNKKAVYEITNIFLGILAAVLLIGALILASQAVSNAFFKKSTQCENYKWWDGKNSLKEILKQVDEGNIKEYLFYNNGCPLISFTFSQGIGKITYPYTLSNEQSLCLCTIEDKVCKPYDCYKFKNYEKINQEQFSTLDLKNYVFLKFIKDGKILRIQVISTEKELEPVKYFSQGINTKTDQNNLINELSIKFKTKIDSFIPIVTQKKQSLLLPEGIQNIDGFTNFFDIELAQVSNIKELETNYKKIDPSEVENTYIKLRIDKEKFNLVQAQDRDKIYLYYKKDQTWQQTKLECSESETDVYCMGNLDGFGNNFAISIGNEIQEQGEIQNFASCKDINQELVVIQQDEKIKCSDKLCCAHQDTVEHLIYTKKFINNQDEYLLIKDAARSATSQRDAFFDFLTGGAEACGPLSISNKKELEENVPNVKGSKNIRIKLVKDWLAANNPKALQIINDLSQYSNCPHIIGRALDVQLQKGKNDQDLIGLRNLMCEAGWANYGKEWWHYEYKTKSYEIAKQNNKCYFSEDKYATLQATVKPGYT